MEADLAWEAALEALWAAALVALRALVARLREIVLERDALRRRLDLAIYIYILQKKITNGYFFLNI
jgi:hypothetical protein